MEINIIILVQDSNHVVASSLSLWRASKNKYWLTISRREAIGKHSAIFDIDRYSLANKAIYFSGVLSCRSRVSEEDKGKTPNWTRRGAAPTKPFSQISGPMNLNGRPPLTNNTNLHIIDVALIYDSQEMRQK